MRSSRSTGCRAFRPSLRKPTPIATRWRSGCIRRARPAGPRASSICSTTWPIATRRLRSNVLKLEPGDICFSVPKIFFAYGFGNSITFPFSVGRRDAAAAGPAEAGGDLRGDRALPPDRVLRPADALYLADQGRRRRQRPISRRCGWRVSAAEVLSAEVFNGWKTAHRARDRRRARLDRGAAHLSLQPAGQKEARRRRPARARL